MTWIMLAAIGRYDLGPVRRPSFGSGPDVDHLYLVHFLFALTICWGVLRLVCMKYLSSQITFQEVPDEISLSFLITGCSLRCPGCHSSDSWNSQRGQELTEEKLVQLIEKYRRGLTCILFMGGEWYQRELISLLKVAQRFGLKTCLYTGLDQVSEDLKQELTFLKTGSYRKELGGLASLITNQKLIEVETGKVLNFHFTAQGGHHGETHRRPNSQEDGIHKTLSSES